MHLGQTVVLLLSVATCVFGVEKKLSEDVRQEDSAPADAAPADAAPADAAPADAAPADAAPADSAPDDAEAPFDLETESPAPGTLEPAAPFDLETESPAPGKPEPVSTEAPFGLETDSPAPGTTEPAATEAPFPHALPPDNDDVPTDAGESPFDECNTTATYSTCTSQCEQQVSDGCGSSRVANCTTGDCVSVGYYLVLSDSGRFFDLALFDAELFMQRLSDALSDRISFVRAVLTYYCLVPNSRINSGITDVDKTSNRCRALNVQASAREASVLQEVCTTSASNCLATVEMQILGNGNVTEVDAAVFETIDEEPSLGITSATATGDRASPSPKTPTTHIFDIEAGAFLSCPTALVAACVLGSVFL